MVRERAEKLAFGVAEAVLAFLLIETIRRGLPLPSLSGLIPDLSGLIVPIPDEIVIQLGSLVIDERFVLFFAIVMVYISILSDEEVFLQFDDDIPESKYDKLFEKTFYGIGVLIVFVVLFIPVSLIISFLAGFVGVDIRVGDAMFWLTLIVTLLLIYDAATWEEPEE